MMPSMVLFQLLGMLIQSGEKVGTIADIMLGENPGQNQPYSTTSAVLEQGLKVFVGIYKRVYRSLSEEYKTLFYLNSKYLEKDTYENILDDELAVLDSDFLSDSTGVSTLDFSTAFGSVLLVSCAAQAQWQGNWLVGISGGYAEQDGNLTTTLLNTNTHRQTVVVKDIENSDWKWGLLGGYQARCNAWLVGTELEVDWVDNDQNTSFQFTDTEAAARSWSARLETGGRAGLGAR